MAQIEQVFCRENIVQKKTQPGNLVNQFHLGFMHWYNFRVIPQKHKSEELFSGNLQGRLIAGQQAKPGELPAGPVFGNFNF
jgi:hypothetical protein